MTVSAGGLATSCSSLSAISPEPSAPGHRRRHRGRALDAHVEAVVQVGRGVGDKGSAALADELGSRVGRCLLVARFGLWGGIWLGHDGLLIRVVGLSGMVPLGLPSRDRRIPAVFGA